MAKEKIELLRAKDDQIMKARLELKHLEHDLINAKLESACLKSKLDQQQNHVVKLKKDERRFKSKFLENVPGIQQKEDDASNDVM